MSEATAKKGTGMARLVITLLAISAVCACLLGLVDSVTGPRIEAAEQAKLEAAMASVLPADEYTPVEYTGDDTIDSIQKAGDIGYVVQVSPAGSFSGTMTIMVGVTSEGTVSGVEIVKSAETAGLGANASKDWFREQFVGKTGVIRVTKDGGEIDALTGATITSRCVSNGVTSAVAAVAELG